MTKASRGIGHPYRSRKKRNCRCGAHGELHKRLTPDGHARYECADCRHQYLQTANRAALNP